MTQKQHRIGLALAVSLVSSALLLLLVGLLVRSSDRVALGVPLVLGAAFVVGGLLLLGWRAVAVGHTSRR